MSGICSEYSLEFDKYTKMLKTKLRYHFIMSEETKIDAGEIEQAKSSLEHVETKEGGAKTKAVFKCESTGETQEIPSDVLEKMEKDEDISSLIPNCPDGTPMKIVVVEE